MRSVRYHLIGYRFLDAGNSLAGDQHHLATYLKNVSELQVHVLSIF